MENKRLFDEAQAQGMLLREISLCNASKIVYHWKTTSKFADILETWQNNYSGDNLEAYQSTVLALNEYRHITKETQNEPR